MAKPSTVVSATIVLFFATLTLLAARPACAAPDRQAPPDSVASPDDVNANKPVDENMTLTPAPNLSGPTGPAPDARYYPYRQQLTFRGGLSSDFPKIAAPESVLGFQYLFPKFLSPKLEAGADLHADGRGHVHAGVRWIYFERSYWRPSFKFAADHYVDGKLGLATLARKENWYARGGATLEYVVWNPYSVRAEIELLANFDNIRTVLTLGLSRGW